MIHSLRHPIAIAVFLAVATSPFYLFRSGMPQPADALFVCALLMALIYTLANNLTMPIRSHVLIFGILVTWVSVINFSWALIADSTEFIWPSVYYYYNFLIYILVFRFLFSHRGSEALVLYGICIATIASTVFLLLTMADNPRAVGTFNNPNQLAYFSLLALAIILVLTNFRPESKPFIVLAFVCGAVNILAASSLGGFGGLVIVVAAYLIARMGKSGLKPLAAVGGMLLLVVVVDQLIGAPLMENVETRLDRVERKVSEAVEERRYTRILVYPQYTILGAGEAEFEERFPPFGSAELHSSLGTLLFSYGLPGLGLFLAFIVSIVWRAPFHIWVLLGAPMFYGLAHMGLRFTLFWIFMAVLAHKYGAARRKRLVPAA